MLTKKVVIGLINVLESGVLQVRRDTVLLEDDVELSRTYFREVVNPGDDVSEKDERIKLIAGVIWTDEVVAAWKEQFAKLNQNLLPNG